MGSGEWGKSTIPHSPFPIPHYLFAFTSPPLSKPPLPKSLDLLDQISIEQISCKSKPGFGSAAQKGIEIVKGVAQTVQLEFLHMSLRRRRQRILAGGAA